MQNGRYWCHATGASLCCIPFSRAGNVTHLTRPHGIAPDEEFPAEREKTCVLESVFLRKHCGHVIYVRMSKITYSLMTSGEQGTMTRATYIIDDKSDVINDL